MKILNLLLTGLVVLLLCGCENMNQMRAKSGNSVCFAVLPFENLSGDPNAGLKVMSDLESALSASKQHKIIEPSEVRVKLEPYQQKYLEPQKMAELLGAQAVVTGTVTEYRYVYGAGEQPVVSVNLRVISAKTGRTVYAKSYTSSGAFSWLKEASLGEIAKRLSQKIASDLEVEL